MSDPAAVSDAAFAREFIRRAVTEQRVSAALASLASQDLRFGPYSAAGLARVAATGRLGTARVETSDAAKTRAFAVTVPATLDLAVRLGGESRLRADVEIDLLLTPRPAAPLLLVIDIAPVRAPDVRIEVRGSGLGASLGGLLTGLAEELRAQVAKQITAVLDGDRLRRSRTFDIAARIDGKRDADPPDPWEWIEDERFGRQFIRRAVTEERLHEALAGLSGQPVEFGPLKGGPKGVATARVTGAVGEPVVRSADASFHVTLPLSLDLVVDLARGNRFHCDVEVLLVAKARPAEGLRIVIDIAPVEPDAVQVALTAGDRMAGLVGRVGRIQDQLRQQVAKTVNQRVAAATGRVIDIGERIERAGASRRADRPRPQSKRPAPRPNRVDPS